MFKEILGTILCTTFSVKATPNKAYIGANYIASGCYTLKDNYDFTQLNQEMTENTYTMTIGVIGIGPLYMYGNNESRPSSDITITATRNNNIVQCRIEGEDRYGNAYQIFDLVDNHDINFAEEGGDFSSLIQNYVLYFNQDYYFSGTDITLFTSLFTQEGNRYVKSYNGYYHYNSTNWIRNYEFYYFGCTFLVNNTYTNYYNHDTTRVEFENSNGSEVFYEIEVYSSTNGYTEVGNIIVQGLLPISVYTCMQQEGAFSYIQPPTQQVEFSEFFFGIIDAPLYYIWSLFNWELFGMNLFIAFCGLITMALIIAIVKKVV